MRGVFGTDKARPYAAQAPAEFDPMYEYIDSDLGGYGLYYGTTMAATGLVIPALPQAGVPFDAPTSAGQRAAAAFREAIAGTTYYREYFGHPDRPVPAAVVLEYARAACLCQLQADSAPDRPLLRDVFCYGGDPVPCQNPACCPDLLVYARRSCSFASSTSSWSGCWLAGAAGAQ